MERDRSLPVACEQNATEGVCVCVCVCVLPVSSRLPLTDCSGWSREGVGEGAGGREVLINEGQWFVLFRGPNQ